MPLYATRDVIELAIGILDLRLEVAPDPLQSIPKEGPLIVVSNHPHGAVDGLALAYMLRSVRPDAMSWANYLLRDIPGLDKSMIFLDPFERPESARINVAAIKESIRCLRNGGILGVLPAGEVSHLNLRTGRLADPPWTNTVARLIRKTQAPVLPVFFFGRNSIPFYLARLVHPLLRTALLARAFIGAKGSRMRMRIGKPIPPSKLESFESDEDLMNYLRMRTYLLESQGPPKAPVRASRKQKLPPPQQETVIDPIDPVELIAELAEIPLDQRLVEAGPFQVWLVEFDQAPRIVQEIGRLREITFRAAGEGTGKSCDLDRFDRYYQHMFVWNTDEQELVGSYRLGMTDQILPRYGREGLYTNTLFRFSPQLLNRINPALELGRSFVRTEYQRQHAPLALLWKGIGTFIVRHPQYNHVFGPVSISNRYESLSQRIMIAFLKAHSHLPDMAKRIKPRNPPRWRQHSEMKAGSHLFADINEVSSLISDIELDRKGVPVLLRQYLRLNAKFLSCNVDPEFSGVLDGLMLADLTQADLRILERYFGKEGVMSFLAYHRRHGRLVG